MCIRDRYWCQNFEILCWSVQWRSSTPLPYFYRPTVCTFPLEKVHYYPSHEKVCPKQLNDLRSVVWLTSLEKDRWKRLWSHSFSLLFTPCLVHCSLHTGQEEALKMSSCDFWIRCISTWSFRTLMPRLLCADFSSAFNAMQPRVLAQNLIYSSAWPGLVECRFF